MTSEPATVTPTTEPALGVAPDASPRTRGRLRAVLRWATATALCLAAGAGSALAVVHANRTDLPGLKATPSDGRYVYPALRLPALPPGANGPDEGGGAASESGAGLPHAIADIRLLLLPTPVGGRLDPALRQDKGWVAMGDFAKLFRYPAQEVQLLRENGARQVAATGWTMPDGTHVAIYLVPFLAVEAAEAAYMAEYGSPTLAQAPGGVFSTVTWLGQASAQSVDQPAKGGSPAVRAAFFARNEITGLLVMTNPKQVNPVDFQQALTLQSELLAG